MQIQHFTATVTDAPEGVAATEACIPQQQHGMLVDEAGFPVLPDDFCFDFDTPMGALPSRHEDSDSV